MPESRPAGRDPIGGPGYDFASKWAPVPDWDSVHIDRPDVAISCCRPGAMVVVNGGFHAALDLAGIDSAPVGWPDVARGRSYAVRLARERVLIVGGTDLASGWHESGFAVSRAEDAAVVFEASGPGTGELLSSGAEVFFDHPSACAVRVLAGMPVILYRHDREYRVRMHVARPSAAGFFSWLSAATHRPR